MSQGRAYMGRTLDAQQGRLFYFNTYLKFFSIAQSTTRNHLGPCNRFWAQTLLRLKGSLDRKGLHYPEIAI